MLLGRIIEDGVPVVAIIHWLPEQVLKSKTTDHSTGRLLSGAWKLSCAAMHASLFRGSGTAGALGRARHGPLPAPAARHATGFVFVLWGSGPVRSPHAGLLLDRFDSMHAFGPMPKHPAVSLFRRSGGWKAS